MKTGQMQQVLTHPEKIEKAMARIYERFSQKKQFTEPVRAFWDQMAREELFHAGVFREMHDKFLQEAGIPLEIEIDLSKLKAFVEKTRTLLKEAAIGTLTEDKAYTLGALMEAELNESRFLDKIRTPDPDLTEKIRRIRNDTQKHNLMLVNYSKGIF